MKQILGIDIGGTKIAAGLVTPTGKISKVRVLPTSQSGLLMQVQNLINGYDSYDGLGLGVPGIVGPGGMVREFRNIKNFRPLNLRKYLAQKFDVPVSVINDAEAFTLAQSAHYGKFKKVFGVTLGTGIGGGLSAGRAHRNMQSFLHQRLPGLERRMQKFGPFTKASQAAPYVREIIPLIVRTFNPDAIVFGGGRAKFPSMQKVLNQSLKSIFPKGVKTKVFASHLKHAGIIGASLPLLKR